MFIIKAIFHTHYIPLWSKEYKRATVNRLWIQSTRENEIFNIFLALVTKQNAALSSAS